MTDLSRYTKYNLVDYTRTVHNTLINVDTSVIPSCLPVGTITTMEGIFNTTSRRLPDHSILYYLANDLSNEPYDPSRFYKLLLPSCMLDDDTVTASPQYTITWPDNKDFAYLGNKNPLKKYILVHVEKPLLSTLFLDNEKNKFYTPESVSIYQTHHKLLTKLSEIFSTDSSILQSIDFYKFSTLYNSYMDMLVFFLTNKHALSYELRDEYIQKIYEKSVTLKHEANDILKVIQAKQEFNFKAVYDSEKLRQEMIDSEARSIMPLDD